MNTSTNINGTSPATEPAQFDFRNKFKKLLNDENRPAIEDVFRKFCKLFSDDALDRLWELTYRADYTYAFRKLHLDPNLIPAESVIALRNELRFQYQQSHPDFPYVNIPANCEEAFEKLQQHTDFITSIVVYDTIFNKMYLFSSELEDALFLLSKEEEHRYCGGLKALGFKYTEIEYLKQFHKEIYELLKAMLEYHSHTTGGDSSNRPFAGLDERLEEVGFELSEEGSDRTSASSAKDQATTSESTGASVLNEEQGTGAPVLYTEVSPDVSSDSEQQFVPVTAFEVLTRKGAFSFLLESSTPMNYLHALQNLQGIGFDLNEVMKKTEKIKALLVAIGDLDA